MAENKMKEVAKLLGVELEEEFKIEGLSIKYKLTEDGLMCWHNSHQDWFNSSILGDLLAVTTQIVKIPKPFLTAKEKEYLSAVIKPFRDRIISIRKYKYSQDEYIGIYI